MIGTSTAQGSHPLVSIVVCTYNQEAFVRETLESIVQQTYPHVEIIVSDDGSLDATPAIIREYQAQYPDKFKPVFSAHNTGIPANINRGLKQITGELVAWLDGDDLMLPNKIERQVRVMQQHPSAIGCYHDCDVFDSETGNSLGSFNFLYNGLTKLREGALEHVLQPRYFGIPSATMARAWALPAHGYDERLKHFSESVFFMEVFRNGNIVAINEILGRYRRHAHNLTSSASLRNVSYEYELLAYAIMEARYPEMRDFLQNHRVACMLTEALWCTRNNKRERANTIIHNVVKSGSVAKGLVAYLSVNFAGTAIKRMTGNSLFTRSPLIKRLSRFFLR